MENKFNYLKPETQEEKMVWEYKFTDVAVAELKKKYDIYSSMSELLKKYGITPRPTAKRRGL